MNAVCIQNLLSLSGAFGEYCWWSIIYVLHYQYYSTYYVAFYGALSWTKSNVFVCRNVTMVEFIYNFSLLIFLSFTFKSNKYRNQFSISSTYFDMVGYLKRETCSSLISYEVRQNHIWTDNIQSFEMPF